MTKGLQGLAMRKTLRVVLEKSRRSASYYLIVIAFAKQGLILKRKKNSNEDEESSFDEIGSPEESYVLNSGINKRRKSMEEK